ncbi:hypothetical protein ACHAXH_000716 [Discostella pseudostelligera]
MADIDIVDITTPRSVLYCDACGMPPEYCSYGPDFETHCLPWLKAKHPQLYEKLHADHIIATAATAAADGLGDAVASASASAHPNHPNHGQHVNVSRPSTRSTCQRNLRELTKF